MLIGEVAQRSGVSTRMLRHYESLGLVQPTGRTVGGYREYAADDIDRIFHVECLRSLGLSLRQVGRALEDPAFTPSALVADLVRRTEDRLKQEQELLDRLRAVDASAPSGWPGVLRIVELLHGLSSTSAAQRQQTVLGPQAEDVTVPVELLARAVLVEGDPNVAGALRWALARAGAAGVASVASGLHAEDVDVRRRAVTALAELPGDESTAALAGALQDADPAVRGNAALASGARGQATAVPALVAMVVEGRNDVEAAEVLAGLASDPTAAEVIMRALADELAARPADSAVRIRLVQALAEMPRALAQDVLRRLVHDDDRAVALFAAGLVRATAAPRGDPLVRPVRTRAAAAERGSRHE